jgi:cytochrome c oxidase subunit II
MFNELPLMPKEGSTFAGSVDALYLFLVGLTALVTVLIAGLIVYFGVRYRRRREDYFPRPIVGSLVLETVWSVIPFLVMLFIFGWSARIYLYEMRPPDDAQEVYVVGRQWMWKLQHPDGQREINELHIPVGRPVRLIMTSEDVIHSFYVPEFRIKQDVLPGRYTSVWFQATKAGRYHLYCAEYCGAGHSVMVGSVIAMEEADYGAWLGSQAEGSLALRGRKRFLQLQCITCHTGRSDARAPNLEGIFNTQVRLQDGRTVPADEGYLRRSILQPNADVVAGFQPIMPTYQDRITEEELIEVVAFLKALGPGQTPTRNEETPPPPGAVGPPP